MKHIQMEQIQTSGAQTEVEILYHESEQKEFKSRLEPSSAFLQPISSVLEQPEGQDQLCFHATLGRSMSIKKY